MDLFEAITKRHSYRGPFDDQPVLRSDLIKIVEAGLRAPSGKNAQTTTFVIVDNPEIVAEIASMHPTNVAMQQAKAYIICSIDRIPMKTYEAYSFQVEDCAAAVENMLLAITALGYATVWVDGWLRLGDNAERIGSLIELPLEKIAKVILPVGVPKERSQQAEKLPFNKRAWFNLYGNE